MEVCTWDVWGLPVCLSVWHNVQCLIMTNNVSHDSLSMAWFNTVVSLAFSRQHEIHCLVEYVLWKRNIRLLLLDWIDAERHHWHKREVRWYNCVIRNDYIIVNFFLKSVMLSWECNEPRSFFMVWHLGCSPGTCKISKWYEHFIIRSCTFQSLQDLMIRHLMWYWIRPQTASSKHIM